MLIIKHRKVFGGYLIILGILVLLFLACAPKQTEIPKQYTPPELTDEDLEIEKTSIQQIQKPKKMSKTKNGFRDFFHILIGVNIGHVIFGAAIGSQELVLTGGLSIAACRLAIYAKEKSNEQ